ncbi:MAG: YjbE family putative metal transport protein [Hyphomonadaceae bacterium]
MDLLIADIAALIQVIIIDLALAGDNAVAVGLAASALPKEQQRRAIMIGIIGALVLRIVFALATTWLLQFSGILFFGGLLLIWVGWRMWKDLEAQRVAAVVDPDVGVHAAEEVAQAAAPASFGRALLTIIIADVSMSLDNVLAVAGVARHNQAILAFGLVLSVVLMGVAAGFIARIIEKHRWIAIVGIVIILFAATRMMWEDLHVWFPAHVPAIPHFLGGQHALPE